MFHSISLKDKHCLKPSATVFIIIHDMGDERRTELIVATLFLIYY